MNENDQPLADNMPAQEQSTMPETDNGQIFNSEQFTGVKEDEEKPKRPSIFTKWQTWAIISGVVAVAAVIAIIVIINSINENNSQLVSRYDAASAELGHAIESMDSAYDKVAHEAYGLGESAIVGSDKIYPSDAEFRESKYACLGRFGVSVSDIDYIKMRKTGQELLDSGINLNDEIDRVTNLSASYHSAIDAVEACSTNALDVVAKQFQIEFGELTLTRDAEISKFMDFSQPVTITYNGDKDILSVSLIFGLYDKNGIKGKIDRTIFMQDLSKGATVEKDLYNNAYKYRTLEENADAESRLTPRLIEIRGLYK